MQDRQSILLDQIYRLRDEFDRAYPIRKSLRGKARLWPSQWTSRGFVYRLKLDGSTLTFISHPEMFTDKPIILINTEDLKEITRSMPDYHEGFFLRWEQQIADVCEELFARMEETGLPPTTL